MRILIVDDEPNVRGTLKLALESMGHSVDEAVDVREGAVRIETSSYDLAFVDMRLRQESGLDLLEAIRAAAPRTAVVIITAYATIDTAVDAMRRGAFDYLPKPFTPAQIRAILERSQRHRSLEQRLSDLEEQIGREVPEVLLASDDVQSQRLLELARQVAGTDAFVLLRGASGTGKGVVARAIHAWSRRAAGPFVTISCPSLSGELLESALFGHSRGAFTGAVRDTEGKVAAAEGGTLLLDEIGDLPLSLQPKLLRFLQERRYERIGETCTRAADVRVLAATNHDLDEAVAAGRFRADLLFRVSVVELAIPPLCTRSDRLALASHFLGFFARQMGRKIDGFTAESEDAIMRYAWPGNLRELRNAIERAVIFAKGPLVSPHDLPERVLAGPSVAVATTPELGSDLTIEALEAAHIKLVLERSTSREDAARILGIDPSTLYRKRRQLGI
jgi:NtrC-family two-component system response regulator AlgB